MVFVKSVNYPDKIIGVVVIRDSGKYISLLVIESIFGLIVAMSNLLIDSILILGWRRLWKNNFYIVLANLIGCTSLKAFVEFAFILPYYVMQSDGNTKSSGYFALTYELIIFNVSVFADYGVLFFSLLIAANRFLSVTCQGVSNSDNRLQSVLSCIVVWMCAAIIPVLFFILECHYEYDDKRKLYVNKCSEQLRMNGLETFLDCLIYLSYVCALVVLLLYLLILRSLNRQKSSIVHINGKHSPLPRAQVQLLKQSVSVFALYAASISCVFAMSFVEPDNTINAFDIAYVENLLNLSIAAAYPCCFLAMSGELKSILVRNFTFHASWSTTTRTSRLRPQVTTTTTTPESNQHEHLFLTTTVRFPSTAAHRPMATSNVTIACQIIGAIYLVLNVVCLFLIGKMQSTCTPVIFRVLLALQITFTVQNFHLNVLFVGFLHMRISGGYCTGLLCEPHYVPYSINLIIHFYLTGHICIFFNILLFLRHQTLLDYDSPVRFGRCGKISVAAFWLSFGNSLPLRCVIGHATMSTSERELKLQQHTLFSVWAKQHLNFDVIPMKSEADKWLIGFLTVTYSSFVLGTTLHILKLIYGHNQKRSVKKWKLAIRQTRQSLIQIATFGAVLTAPVALLMSPIFFDFEDDNVVLVPCVLLYSLNSLSHSMLTIIQQTPLIQSFLRRRKRSTTVSASHPAFGSLGK